MEVKILERHNDFLGYRRIFSGWHKVLGVLKKFLGLQRIFAEFKYFTARNVLEDKKNLSA